MAEAERAPIVERVALERFTREEMVAQLTGILGRRPEARLVDELFARAEGNPFFTEELAAAATGERLPANVADALMLRVEALSPPAQAVLRLAAVAGPAREPRAARARGRRSRPTSSSPDCARRWRTTSS